MSDSLLVPSPTGTSDDDPSGALVAAQAHQAGQVAPTVRLDCYDLHVHVVVRAHWEAGERLRDALVLGLLENPIVQAPVDCSLTLRGNL